MGTHMRILGESFPMSTNMTEFRWFSKIFATLCFECIGRVKGENHIFLYRLVFFLYSSLEYVMKISQMLWFQWKENKRTVWVSFPVMDVQETLGCHTVRIFCDEIKKSLLLPFINKPLLKFEHDEQAAVVFSHLENNRHIHLMIFSLWRQ